MAGQTNSMALQAFCSLSIFDLLFIGTALLSNWIMENDNAKVRQKSQSSTMSSSSLADNSTALFLPTETMNIFSYGTARFEVLAVFTSTMLSILGAFFILKESIEKYLEDETIHTEYLMLASTLTFIIHMIVIYSVRSKAFDFVITASASSWLQAHVNDIFQSLCHYIPGLSRLLLPRINPLALLCWCGLAIIYSDSCLLRMGYSNCVDTLTALLMAFMIFGTMVPMAIYSGRILLQTIPAHISGQLDRCLHEASSLDGVLELYNEHFWALSFGKLVGSLHVRCRYKKATRNKSITINIDSEGKFVSNSQSSNVFPINSDILILITRDANEQLVLAHVWHKLANVVQILTIHVLKDDWLHPQTRTFIQSQNDSLGTWKHPSNQDAFVVVT